MFRSHVLAGMLGLVGLVVLAAPQARCDDKPTEPAYLNVKVPANAKLEIEGRPTMATGELRLFMSPPLVPGKKYTYTLKVIVPGPDGKEVTRTETVPIVAGKTVDVDLTAVKPVDKPKTEEKPKDKPRTEEKPKTEEPPTRRPDVIFVPTPQEVVDKMLEVAGVKKGEVVYDLGCGDGRIPVTAAKKYGVKAYGFDIDPERIKESKENVKKNNVGDLVTIDQKDIFTLDLSKADVVTLYLLPSLNVKLIPQLEKLKPGSRIVSHDFDMRGVKPDKVINVTPKDQREHTIYLWTVPLKKEKE